MAELIHILHLEDDPMDAELVQSKIAEAELACRITQVQTRAELEDVLRHNAPDIILADYRLPSYDGMSALRLTREMDVDIPFIFVSGTMGEETAIEALTRGATDYVLKQNLSRLAPAVRRALQEAQTLHERRQAQEALQHSNRIDAARLRLMQFAAAHCLDELLEEAVNEAENLSESQIGFYHVVDDDQQSLTLQAWSTRTKTQFCIAQSKGSHFPIADSGVWMDCMRQRKPVVHNDYSSLPHRKGLPEGHPDVVRELVVPVMRGNTIKAVLGVGNKPGDYSERDVAAMSLLADLAWEITDRKQAEQQVALMSFALNSTHEAAFMLDEQACFHYVNEEASRSLGYSRDELTTMKLLDIIPGLEIENWSRHWSDLKAHGALTFERQMKGRDGHTFPVEINANYFEYQGVSYNFGLVRDITERKQAERERLANLKFFENMDKVNRAIQGESDLEQMMVRVLDVVIEVFDCDKTQLIYPCNSKADTWSVQMERTKPGYESLAPLSTDFPMTAEIAEMHRLSRRTNTPIVFGANTNLALTPEQIKMGHQSGMGMAIYPKNTDAWGFSLVQCSHPRIWTQEEIRLFEAIGRRIADSLTSLLSYRDLRNNEEFLDNVVEHIPDMIFVKDAQALRFVRFNKAGEQLVGCSRKALLGKTDYDLFPKDVADLFMARDRQVLDSKKPVDIAEETIRNRDGEERILHTKKIPIMDEAGTPQYLLGISEDITERKQAAESIRKLSQAIEQSPVSIVITDTKGTIEFVNARFTQITGYTYDEALGRNPRILKSGETSREEYRRLWETIASGGVWEGEFHNRKKSGDLFWERATIAPVRNTENRITHYVAVKEDITQRKKLEEQLRQAQKMESVGRLAGGVAHDFNNMLGVVIGYTELALAQMEPDHPLVDHLKQIFSAAKRSGNLTRQLLAFARQQVVTPKVLDLNETVEGMIKMLRRLIGEDIELTWKPGTEVWPVKIDPVQIDQILVNLCVNARDAIAGVGTIIIETGQATFRQDYCITHPGSIPGEFSLLSVSDDGHGMDKSLLDKIFEPFFTTKERGKGTGLGLATVYGIVKQNDGYINVYSEPGCGTTFRIYLPRHLHKGALAEKDETVSSISHGHETILLVEDDPSILEMTKLTLEHLGYRVLPAATPGEAMRMAGKYQGDIDLLFTDVIMPEMNGYDLARQLLSLYPSIRHLFMSGYTGDFISRRGVLDEGVQFIQKPFTVDALSAKLAEVLGES